MLTFIAMYCHTICLMLCAHPLDNIGIPNDVMYYQPGDEMFILTDNATSI